MVFIIRGKLFITAFSKFSNKQYIHNYVTWQSNWITVIMWVGNMDNWQDGDYHILSISLHQG